MITIEYKIFCSVRMLHDYYLIGSNHNSFFSLSQSDQEDALTRKIVAGLYDIRRDLIFQVGSREKEIMRNQKIRFLPGPLGFDLAMEVKSERLADGTVRYRPAKPLEMNTILRFGLALNNPVFGNLTSIRIFEPDRRVYHFSNVGSRVQGTLSNPPPQLSSGISYKMGDLVLLNGIVQQAMESNQGDDTKWQPVSGNGFVTEADRKLEEDEDWFRDWQLDIRPEPVKTLGVIELKLHTTPSGQTLIDQDGLLLTARAPGELRARAPRFDIRFLSRSTYWRYQRRKGLGEDEINDLLQLTSGFLERDGRRLITKEPRYFSQIRTVFGPVNSPFSLPNALPDSIRAEGTRTYSDVFFSKINPIPK